MLTFFGITLVLACYNDAAARSPMITAHLHMHAIKREDPRKRNESFSRPEAVRRLIKAAVGTGKET